MKKEPLYWCYAEEPKNDNIIIEHTLRYADVDRIKAILEKYGIDRCRAVWEKLLVPDKRMEKLNFFLGKFIFNISSDDAVIRNYLTINRKTRIERINEILNR